MKWLVLVTALVVACHTADLSSCYGNNQNAVEGDLGKFRISSKDKAECYIACRRYGSGCIAFVFRTRDGYCWLKKAGHKAAYTRNGYMFGEMTCFNEKLAADTEESTGEKVKYEFAYQTSGAGANDGGSENHYVFAVIGTKGETAEHECAGKREKGKAGSCAIEDSADIGDVTGLRIANGFDDTWKFTKMVVTADGVTMPSYNGLQSVEDFTAVTIEFSADPDSCYLDKIWMSGGDIKSYTTLKKDKAECYESCRRYGSQCIAFAMTKSNGRCYLKKEGHRDPTVSSNAVSGRMDCFREKGEAEPESEYVNVARLETVELAQSGVRSGAVADRAVDGNTNTRWDLAGCTYSWTSYLNYWQITLDKSYKIDHVIIYGISDVWRNDEGILDGANILIGGQICQKISGMKENMASMEGQKFDCNGEASKRTGKVVRIESWALKLVICEIEINVRKEEMEEAAPTLGPALQAGQEVEEFYNVAWKKEASQTSEAHGGSADKAVDGWTAQNWAGSQGSCTHTAKRGSDHWKVDLGRVYQIDHIRVWGLDTSASAYMANAMLFVDSNLCGRLKDMKKTGPQQIKCDSSELMAGRYVTIAAGTTYLAICEVQVMVKKADLDKTPATVTWPGERVGGFTNVAFNHVAVNEESTATQSSTHANGYARRANDGNRNGHWGYGSVTHTGRSGLQYWQVDLGRVYKIHHITIFGRTDCCSERIEGARVVVGRTLQVATDLKKPTKPADPIEIDLSEREEAVYGGKVTVELINQYLSLAEVEVWVANEDVFGDEMPTVVPAWENVAIRRPSNQSSTHGDYSSARAIDNFPSVLRPDKGSCSHTGKEVINFWQVDLEKEFYIDHITVYGRNDNDGAAKRINGAILQVDGRTVGGFVYKNVDEKFLFPLNGLKGQLVKIILTGEYLTICEVQVMVNHDYEPGDAAVEPIEASEPNLASSAEVSSSSSMYGAVASLVTDGNVEGNFFGGSCFFAGPSQNGNWVKLDLTENAKVGIVSIYPRLDYYAYDAINSAEVCF